MLTFEIIPLGEGAFLCPSARHACPRSGPARRYAGARPCQEVRFCRLLILDQRNVSKNNLLEIIRLSAKDALEGEWLRNIDPTG